MHTLGRANCSRVSLGLLCFFCLLVVSERAEASSFYVSGSLNVSSGTGTATGDTRFADGDINGSGGDSSPVYGGALGYEFPLDRAIPFESRIPGSNLRVSTPDWSALVELEALAGRDYEFTTERTFDPDKPFRSNVSAWSVLGNFWLEIPVYKPLSAIFGRVPFLEPLRLVPGAGVGISRVSVATTDAVADGGANRSVNFAWQAGAGLAYHLTDKVTFQVGYRYTDLGKVSVPLFPCRFYVGIGYGKLDDKVSGTSDSNVSGFIQWSSR